MGRKTIKGQSIRDDFFYSFNSYVFFKICIMSIYWFGNGNVPPKKMEAMGCLGVSVG